MKKKAWVAVALGLALAVGGAVYVQRAEAISLRALIDLLLQRNIIPAEQKERAQEAVDVLSVLNPDAVDNPDAVELSASQLIEFGDRTYREGDPIEGLILVVKNTGEETLALKGRRKCVLSYAILASDGTELYNSADRPVCNTGEEITYYLGPGKSRMLRMRHVQESYPLKPGRYTVRLDYPPYGSRERTITVVPR